MTASLLMLVVEDYEPFRRAICSWLRKQDFQVMETDDGLDAMTHGSGTRAQRGSTRMCFARHQTLFWTALVLLNGAHGRGLRFPVRREKDPKIQGSVFKFDFVNIQSGRADAFEVDRLNGSQAGDHSLELRQLLTSYACKVRAHES